SHRHSCGGTRRRCSDSAARGSRGSCRVASSTRPHSQEAVQGRNLQTLLPPFVLSAKRLSRDGPATVKGLSFYARRLIRPGPFARSFPGSSFLPAVPGAPRGAGRSAHAGCALVSSARRSAAQGRRPRASRGRETVPCEAFRPLAGALVLRLWHLLRSILAHPP